MRWKKRVAKGEKREKSEGIVVMGVTVSGRQTSVGDALIPAEITAGGAEEEEEEEEEVAVVVEEVEEEEEGDEGGRDEGEEEEEEDCGCALRVLL